MGPRQEWYLRGAPPPAGRRWRMEQFPPGVIRVGEEGWKCTPHRLQLGDERRQLGIEVVHRGPVLTAQERIPLLVEDVCEDALVTLHGAPPQSQPGSPVRHAAAAGRAVAVS